MAKLLVIRQSFACRLNEALDECGVPEEDRVRETLKKTS